ncbi:MAG: hypothetical protein AB4911_04655 [Oscillochloridaceae bacterium umkhey_bin13]
MLETCRWVYNETVATRTRAWKEQGQTLGLYDTQALLPDWKAERPALKRVHSQVLQNVQVRVDLAFKAFFRRVKAGEEPGYPRFQGLRVLRQPHLSAVRQRGARGRHDAHPEQDRFGEGQAAPPG